MKENFQIGKLITFFVLALFLNYFLGVFFADLIVYLQKLYVEHIGNKWTPLWLEMSMYYLYVIYILIYALLASFVLNFFVRINKTFIQVHLSWLLISILVFIFFILNPSLGNIVVSKFILALPFISIIWILLYWITNWRLELFHRSEGETETTTSFLWGDRFNSRPEVSAYWNQPPASNGPWLFSSIFADIKSSFNKWKEEDTRREEENRRDIFNNPNPQPLTPNSNANVGVNDEILNKIESLDLDSFDIDDSTIKETLIRQDANNSALDKINALSEKDIAKIWKDTIQRMNNNGWIDDKELDIENFDIHEVQDEMSAIRPLTGGSAINLWNFVRQQDNMDYDSENSQEYSQNTISTEDLWNKEAIIAAGWLASLIKAANMAPAAKKEQEEVQETSILDNLENSYFIGFTEDDVWVQQLERLYKEL